MSWGFFVRTSSIIEGALHKKCPLENGAASLHAKTGRKKQIKQTPTRGHCRSKNPQAGATRQRNSRNGVNMTGMRRFEGLGAVITGGASGIGLAVAERIIEEGGSVVIWDQDQAKLDAAARVLGSGGTAAKLDLTDPDAVERATAAAETALGHIDVLVCSAGVAGLNALVVDYPIEEWKKVFDVNVNGLFYCNRFVARAMKARGYGRIVNIASIAGKEGNPTASAYSASKAAVIGLTKSLGKELAKSGICVNAITPATIETPMLAQVSQAHIDYMRSKIPMERFGEVAEVAALVCWLSSRECSFTTGAVFDISGGRATY
jgi:NAD(P)-dependent dehydrogenase (short-subunit alcohol dehydrogenase family)